MKKQLLFLCFITIIALNGFSQVNVTKPNGGESLSAYSTYQITWMDISVSFHPVVTISYSDNGGTNWTVITSNAPNNGKYTWTVPNSPSTQCLVKVEFNGTAFSDVSDNTFTIKGSVGIQNVSKSNPVIFFPSPAKDELTINAEEFVETVSFYNLIGEEIKQIKAETLSKTFKLSVTDLPSGIYFVRVNSNTSKLIIAH